MPGRPGAEPLLTKGGARARAVGVGAPTNNETAVGAPTNNETAVGAPTNNETAVGAPTNNATAGPSRLVSRVTRVSPRETT
jgi:hypothetical protein